MIKFIMHSQNNVTTIIAMVQKFMINAINYNFGISNNINVNIVVKIAALVQILQSILVVLNNIQESTDNAFKITIILKVLLFFFFFFFLKWSNKKN